jgi:hypothetical protein
MNMGWREILRQLDRLDRDDPGPQVDWDALADGRVADWLRSIGDPTTAEDLCTDSRDLPDPIAEQIAQVIRNPGS